MQFYENKVTKKKKCKDTLRTRNRFWQTGEILTKKDLELLEEVKLIYKRQGYVPSKKEISNVAALKGRFRTWKDVLRAAGLPNMHDAEQVQKRQKAAMRKRTGKQNFSSFEKGDDRE